ncbi:uncharacterized protein LOC126679950 [Mercurialis annua]|uniref:uncharacterized protein LOC126679950 n=1 Tax=Mercurialis annua TaxID=3986 RepID=UPI002160BA5C|nr:uncharacterized protein LOC126679950 [Mercurialis annua]
MEGYRSMSCRDGRTQITEHYEEDDEDDHKPAPRSGMQDLRSYSVSHAGSVQLGKELKIKKGKNNSNLGSSSSLKNWSFNDPELQRKKRVASYKVYSVEEKMKGSFRKSFRWIKDSYTQVVYGWR